MAKGRQHPERNERLEEDRRHEEEREEREDHERERAVQQQEGGQAEASERLEEQTMRAGEPTPVPAEVHEGEPALRPGSERGEFRPLIPLAPSPAELAMSEEPPIAVSPDNEPLILPPVPAPVPADKPLEPAP
jgi:hypothetical protein